MSGADIDENGVPRNPDLLVVMDCIAVKENVAASLQNGVNYVLHWYGETTQFVESTQYIVTITKRSTPLAEEGRR